MEQQSFDDIWLDYNTVGIQDAFSSYSTSQFALSADAETFNKPHISIDGYKIDAVMVEKIKALLDVIEQLDDDNELKCLLNTQLAFNRLARKE